MDYKSCRKKKKMLIKDEAAKDEEEKSEVRKQIPADHPDPQCSRSGFMAER